MGAAFVRPHYQNRRPVISATAVRNSPRNGGRATPRGPKWITLPEPFCIAPPSRAASSRCLPSWRCLLSLPPVSLPLAFLGQQFEWGDMVIVGRLGGGSLILIAVKHLCFEAQEEDGEKLVLDAAGLARARRR